MAVIVHRNQIHLIGDINNKVANDFVEKIEYAASNNAKSIELHISSPGGEVKAAEKIMNQIQLSEKTVITYIHNAELYGGARGVCSAASVIVGHTDIRFIDFDAIFMIHHSSAGGVVNPDEDDVFFWMDKTGMDYDIINNLMKGEKYMDADMAKSLGFVNDIIYDTYILPIVNDFYLNHTF